MFDVFLVGRVSGVVSSLLTRGGIVVTDRVRVSFNAVCHIALARELFLEGSGAGFVALPRDITALIILPVNVDTLLAVLDNVDVTIPLPTLAGG